MPGKQKLSYSDITKHLNLRISGQKTNPRRSVKYPGVTLKQNLSFHLN